MNKDEIKIQLAFIEAILPEIAQITNIVEYFSGIKRGLIITLNSVERKEPSLEQKKDFQEFQEVDPTELEYTDGDIHDFERETGKSPFYAQKPTKAFREWLEKKDLPSPQESKKKYQDYKDRLKADEKVSLEGFYEN